MGLTPDFRVVANKKDITDRLRDRLLSLRLSDQAGLESDQVSFDLDDRDGKLALLDTGALLEVWLGYKESGLTLMGVFTVNEISLSSPPQSMSISAKAADMSSKIKEQKTRSWDNTTLGDIVTTIAGEHGLMASVEPALASKSIDHLDQTTDSDMAFLTRLAIQHDALFKVGNGTLLFTTRGDGKSVSGKELTPVTLTRTRLQQWSVTIKDRGQFSAVSAQYRDQESATTVTVTAGDTAGTTDALRHTHADATQAREAAEARLKAIKRGQATINLTVGGDPTLAAEGKINVTGVREGVDGEWLVTSVEHSLDSSGYSCQISGETPNQKADAPS